MAVGQLAGYTVVLAGVVAEGALMNTAAFEQELAREASLAIVDGLGAS